MQPQSTEVIVFLVIANIIVVIAAVFFFLILRIQQKRKQLYNRQLLEKEYKTREEAFLQISRDLHDEMGSSLSGISLFTQMAAEQLQLNHTDAAKMNIDKASTYAGLVIEKVSDMAWLLKPSHESLSILIDKLQSYSRAVAGAKYITIHFTAEPGILKQEITLHQRKAIYLISKEAINNAVKYSNCVNIYYELKMQNSGFVLFIKDDGDGFSEQNINTGNGLQNMKARAAEIGATLTIDSGQGKGTAIHLQL
jgi:signal transduction histidine kinase